MKSFMETLKMMKMIMICEVKPDGKNRMKNYWKDWKRFLKTWDYHIKKIRSEKSRP